MRFRYWLFIAILCAFVACTGRSADSDTSTTTIYLEAAQQVLEFGLTKLVTLPDTLPAAAITVYAGYLRKYSANDIVHINPIGPADPPKALLQHSPYPWLVLQPYSKKPRAMRDNYVIIDTLRGGTPDSVKMSIFVDIRSPLGAVSQPRVNILPSGSGGIATLQRRQGKWQIVHWMTGALLM